MTVLAVNFYELALDPALKVVPPLALKAYEQGARAVILAANENSLEELNKAIWTFKQDAFIPHGTKADGKAERQPIYLTLTEENPNQATIAIITDGRMPQLPFERVYDIFDGTIETELASAKARQQAYQNSGAAVTYFKQNPQGGWDKV